MALNFSFSVSPGHNVSFWQCLREEEILSHTFGGQEVFRRCWGGKEVGGILRCVLTSAQGPPNFSLIRAVPGSASLSLGTQRPEVRSPAEERGYTVLRPDSIALPAPALPLGNRTPASGARSPGSPAAARPSFLTLRAFAVLGGTGVDQQDKQAEPRHAPRAHGWSYRRPGGRGRSRSPGRAETGRAPARRMGEGRGAPLGPD